MVSVNTYTSSRICVGTAALLGLIALAGCGISSIRCEIETDEELLQRVLKETRDEQIPISGQIALPAQRPLENNPSLTEELAWRTEAK